MKWASALSERLDAKGALGDAIDEIRAKLVRDPDLIVLFVSAQHAAQYDALPGMLREAFGDAHILGCSAGGVIGRGQEVEDRPALSLTAATLPDVQVHEIHLDRELPDANDANAWQERLGLSPEDVEVFLVLPDPFTFDAQALLAGLDAAYPKAVKLGGLASGGRTPDTHRLFLGSSVENHGAAVVALGGNIHADTIIAQGCRPVGQPMFITQCQNNLLYEIGEKKPFDALRDLLKDLSDEDKRLFQQSLFVGLEMRDQVEYKPGDFLIRNIIGKDSATGALAVSAPVKQFQVLQFHLRDKDTSHEDLNRMLERYLGEGSAPAEDCGALLFSCMGRGANLYGRPDHDSELFREHMGEIPLGGFFCNGEIGPVGDQTYLHGYTSAFGVFRPKH